MEITPLELAITAIKKIGCECTRDRIEITKDMVDVLSIKLLIDLEMDSLDIVELAMTVEELYDDIDNNNNDMYLEVPNDTYEEWSTIGDIVTYLDQLNYFKG